MDVSLTFLAWLALKKTELMKLPMIYHDRTCPVIFNNVRMHKVFRNMRTTILIVSITRGDRGGRSGSAWDGVENSEV